MGDETDWRQHRAPPVTRQSLWRGASKLVQRRKQEQDSQEHKAFAAVEPLKNRKIGTMEKTIVVLSKCAAICTAKTHQYIHSTSLTAATTGLPVATRSLQVTGPGSGAPTAPWPPSPILTYVRTAWHEPRRRLASTSSVCSSRCPSHHTRLRVPSPDHLSSLEILSNQFRTSQTGVELRSISPGPQRFREAFHSDTGPGLLCFRE